MKQFIKGQRPLDQLLIHHIVNKALEIGAVRCYAARPDVDACPYRKSNPDVLMVQPTKHRPSLDTPVTLNGPSIGRILP